MAIITTDNEILTFEIGGTDLCDMSSDVVSLIQDVTAHESYDSETKTFGDSKMAFFTESTVYFQITVQSDSIQLMNATAINATATDINQITQSLLIDSDYFIDVFYRRKMRCVSILPGRKWLKKMNNPKLFLLLMIEILPLKKSFPKPEWVFLVCSFFGDAQAYVQESRRDQIGRALQRLRQKDDAPGNDHRGYIESNVSQIHHEGGEDRLFGGNLGHYFTLSHNAGAPRGRTP
jgi:hypothetical protein